MLRIRLALVAVVAVTLLFGVAAAAQEISIRLEGDAFRVAGNAAGWKEPAQGWASIFRVYSGTGNGDVPPLAGSYTVEDGVLVFHPRFALVPGVRYRAVFQLPNGKAVEASFEKKRPQLESTTHVTHVYPSTDVLPSNTLKLYIYFSAPMSRGEAWQHIHLLDEKGLPLKFEFVEIQQELWDPNNTRLTVLFDPGRIKRGVLPNEQLGPPIVEGKHYTLVIDRGWQDARGVPLEGEFRKAFRGGPADRTPPDPKTWRVSAPRAASSADLVVDFPKPMDFALLQTDDSGCTGARRRWGARRRRHSLGPSPSIVRRRGGVSRRGNLGRRAHTGCSWTPGSRTYPAIASGKRLTWTNFRESPRASKRRRLRCRSRFTSARAASPRTGGRPGGV